MSKQLILDSPTVIKLTEGYNVEGYRFVTSNFAGEWRWGVNYEIIIQDAQGDLWGTIQQIQVGDQYYNSLEDGNVYFYPVESEVVPTVEYRRVK